MTARTPRERQPAVNNERIRKLAPLLSASALNGWFNGLPFSYELPYGHRLVSRSDGVPIGRARMSWHSNTMLRYTITSSLTYIPISEHPTTVNVRGRQRAVRLDRTEEEIRAGTRFNPKLVDIDHIGQDQYPLVWRFDDPTSVDLIALGARLKTARDPTIVRVQQDTPITVLEAEQALLNLGGILLRASGGGEQGLLFED